MSDTILGECLCAGVRFALAPPLGEMSYCHCRSCRLSHGAAFVTWTSVPAERFAWLAGEDQVRWWRSSPQIRWGFCGRCGSPLFYVADAPGHPEAPTLNHVYVSAGSLTTAIADRPQAHVSYEEHVGWIEGAEALPKLVGKSETPFSG